MASHGPHSNINYSIYVFFPYTVLTTGSYTQDYLVSEICHQVVIKKEHHIQKLDLLMYRCERTGSYLLC